MRSSKEHKPQQSRVISRRKTKIMQRYLINANYAPGNATGIIQNPVGVAPAGNQEYHACHLIAHRFGGVPGGNNIVYMPSTANYAMLGHENRIYHYMRNNPNCSILYDVVAQNFNKFLNTATGANTIAIDIARFPQFQIL